MKIDQGSVGRNDDFASDRPHHSDSMLSSIDLYGQTRGSLSVAIPRIELENKYSCNNTHQPEENEGGVLARVVTNTRHEIIHRL